MLLPGEGPTYVLVYNYIVLLVGSTFSRTGLPNRDSATTKTANLWSAQTAQATRHAELVAIDSILRTEADLSKLRECDL